MAAYFKVPVVSQWIGRRSPSPIMNLPNELLCEIASEISTRHSSRGYVTESADLAAFSSVSRTMNAVAHPLLYKEIAITSERQLYALEMASDDVLARVR